MVVVAGRFPTAQKMLPSFVTFKWEAFHLPEAHESVPAGGFLAFLLVGCDVGLNLSMARQGAAAAGQDRGERPGKLGPGSGGKGKKSLRKSRLYD